MQQKDQASQKLYVANKRGSTKQGQNLVQFNSSWFIIMCWIKRKEISEWYFSNRIDEYIEYKIIQNIFPIEYYSKISKVEA